MAYLLACKLGLVDGQLVIPQSAFGKFYYLIDSGYWKLLLPNCLHRLRSRVVVTEVKKRLIIADAYRLPLSSIVLSF
jgi:hypothetical protein